MARTETAALAAKLKEAMRTVRQPRQSATHGGTARFDYSTRDDIFEVVRHALIEAGVAISTSMTLLSQSDAPKTSSGKPQTRSVIRLDVQLIDTESGEELPSSWCGEAIVADDKGIQGAATQAARFWCIQNFMLMDGRESELYDNSAPVYEAARPEASGEAETLRVMLAGKGLTDEQITRVAEYICEQYKVGRVSEVRPQSLATWTAKMGATSAEDIIARTSKEEA